MLLKKQEKEYKHALSLQREFNKLYRQKRDIEPIKLQTPIHHGYVRSLELNDDAKHRSDYPLILKAFTTLGQHKVYHHNKEFIVRTGKHNRVRTEKHAYMKTMVDPHYAFYYSEESRQKALDKIEEIKKALERHCSIFACECSEHRPTKYNQFRSHYSFKYMWMLKETTKPHYLTHYTPVDGELESRIAQINREMENNNYWQLLTKRRYVNSSTLNYKYDSEKDVIYYALSDLEEN